MKLQKNNCIIRIAFIRTEQEFIMCDSVLLKNDETNVFYYAAKFFIIRSVQNGYANFIFAVFFTLSKTVI
jgi:hypothetical protein